MAVQITKVLVFLSVVAASAFDAGTTDAAVAGPEALASDDECRGPAGDGGGGGSGCALSALQVAVAKRHTVDGSAAAAPAEAAAAAEAEQDRLREKAELHEERAALLTRLVSVEAQLQEAGGAATTASQVAALAAAMARANASANESGPPSARPSNGLLDMSLLKKSEGGPKTTGLCKSIGCGTYIPGMCGCHGACRSAGNCCGDFQALCAASTPDTSDAAGAAAGGADGGGAGGAGGEPEEGSDEPAPVSYAVSCYCRNQGKFQCIGGADAFVDCNGHCERNCTKLDLGIHGCVGHSGQRILIRTYGFDNVRWCPGYNGEG